MVEFRQRTFAYAVSQCSESIQDKLVTINEALYRNNTEQALTSLHEIATTKQHYQPLDYEMLGRLYERIGRAHEGSQHLELRRHCFDNADTLYKKAGKQDRANWVFRHLKFTSTNSLVKYRRN